METKCKHNNQKHVQVKHQIILNPLSYVDARSKYSIYKTMYNQNLMKTSLGINVPPFKLPSHAEGSLTRHA